MKRKRLIVAPIVHEQIRAQVLHIARDSIDNALAWEDRLRVAIKNLAESSGYAVDEDASDRLGFTLHKLVFEGTYLVHFTIDERASAVRGQFPPRGAFARARRAMNEGRGFENDTAAADSYDDWVL